MSGLRELITLVGAIDGKTEHDEQALVVVLHELRALATRTQPAGEDGKDAERYRWLRDPANADNRIWDVIIQYSTSAEEMDAAIDAAMAAPPAMRKGE